MYLCMEEALPEIKQEEWNTVMARPEKAPGEQSHSWVIKKNVWENTPLISAALCQRMAGGEMLSESISGVCQSSCQAGERCPAVWGWNQYSCRFYLEQRKSESSVFAGLCVDSPLGPGTLQSQVWVLWNVNVTFLMQFSLILANFLNLIYCPAFAQSPY